MSRRGKVRGHCIWAIIKTQITVGSVQSYLEFNVGLSEFVSIQRTPVSRSRLRL